MYLGPRGTRWQSSGEDYIMSSFMICTPHQTKWSNQEDW